jgi:hypothetical protein
VANDKYLSIYLKDHLAGATVGVELARRLAGENRDSPYGPELDQLAAEIEEDREALKDLFGRLGVSPDLIKVVGVWAAEKLGRLKLNGELLSYSPLSRLEELEMLSLGVEGKASMWRAFQASVADDPRLHGVDFEALHARAAAQRTTLEGLRERAAREAFAT